MPRKRPWQLRPPRTYAAHVRFSYVHGLSGAALAVIRDLETRDLRPRTVERALRRWTALPAPLDHRLRDPESGCPACEPWDNLAGARYLLGVVADALPRRDGRKFRRQLTALDEFW